MRTEKEGTIYYPNGSDSIGAYVAGLLPEAIKEVKKRMLTDLNHPPSIIIYPSTDQLYESNIGSSGPQTLTLPTFISKGERIVITYNGSYEELKQQLYAGIARSIWEDQQGQGLSAQLQGTQQSSNNTAGNTPNNNQPTQANNNHPNSNPATPANPINPINPIPKWFKEGAIRYFAWQWPITSEDQLRNTMQQQHFTSYQALLSYEPRLGGEAFCYFLTEKYLPTAVAQTFLQLRKKHDLRRAIRLITKHNLDTLYSQCFDYYNKRFGLNDITKDEQLQVEPTGTAAQTVIAIPHSKGIILNTLVSPEKKYIAYVLGTADKRTVYVYDRTAKQTHKIAIYPLAPWIDDHSSDAYPLVAWNPDSKTLCVAIPVKGKVSIYRYTTDGHQLQKDILYGIDGITSLQPLSGSEYLLSAYTKGQSDIVSYNPRTERYTAHTDDVYDDRQPVEGKNNHQLYFLSDRPKKQGPLIWLIGVGYKKDTLWQGVYTVKDKKVIPVTVDTNTLDQWRKLIAINEKGILATHTKYGAENYTLLQTDGSTTPLSHYTPIQYLAGTDEVSTYRTTQDSITIHIESYNHWLQQQQAHPAGTTSPWLADYKARERKQQQEDSILNAARDTTHTILDDVFKNVADNEKNGSDANNSGYPSGKGKHNRHNKHLKTQPVATPYVLQLHSAYFTAQVNNDYYINRYQPYQEYQGQFKFPEVGGMAQGGLTDLFENHHFTIAYRIPSATEGSDFFIKYENTKQTTDWGLTWFRKVESLQPDPNRNWVDENGQPYPNTAKVKTHYYELYLKRPMAYDLSLGLQTAVRQDKTIFLATDKRSLDFPALQSTWSITTLSATWNKLHPTIPYLYKGFYVKAITDVFKGFSQDEAVLFGSTLNLSYHQPLYKYITLVLQGHIGYSGGNEKILYNLGGVDNNVTPRVDTTVHFSQTAPYAFQSLVTPFRGYFQNSLYGNKYVLCNADLYFPIFKTLIPIQTPLPSINNLQLGIFSDAATASETWEANPNNNQWLISYGVSARTTLAGYPLRIDVAWPAGTNRSPLCYFSLNL